MLLVCHLLLSVTSKVAVLLNPKYETSPNNRAYEYKYFEIQVRLNLTLHVLVLCYIIQYIKFQFVAQ